MQANKHIYIHTNIHIDSVHTYVRTYVHTYLQTDTKHAFCSSTYSHTYIHTDSLHSFQVHTYIHTYRYPVSCAEVTKHHKLTATCRKVTPSCNGIKHTWFSSQGSQSTNISHCHMQSHTKLQLHQTHLVQLSFMITQCRSSQICAPALKLTFTVI